jgi:hypothetical protein
MAIVGREQHVPESPIKSAHAFFRSALLNGIPASEPVSVGRIESVLLSRLDFVSITLAADDNPYRIFESLNGKGMALTQADLLRNYFFMRLPVAEHEDLYSRVWYPMQDQMGKWVGDFIRDLLVKDGAFVRSGDVYQTWKRRLDRLSEGQVKDTLTSFRRYGAWYTHLIYPTTEGDQQLRGQLQQLNRWGGTTTYPFLLNLYGEVANGRLGRGELVKILRLIESFLVRRSFANVPTNELNRLFIRLFTQLDPQQNAVDTVWYALSQPGLRRPDDREFEQAILKYPLYRDSRPEQRKLILEGSYGHQEPVLLETLSIEHIMAQTLTSEWMAELGDHAIEVHRDLVHTLGNLTLTGYNHPLSNSPFERKRQILSGSHLELNKEIVAERRWTASEIESRGRRLAERAKMIWPGPRR